jgi:hypothetical protein
MAHLQGFGGLPSATASALAGGPLLSTNVGAPGGAAITAGASTARTRRVLWSPHPDRNLFLVGSSDLRLYEYDVAAAYASGGGGAAAANGMGGSSTTTTAGARTLHRQSSSFQDGTSHDSRTQTQTQGGATWNGMGNSTFGSTLGGDLSTSARTSVQEEPVELEGVSPVRLVALNAEVPLMKVGIT